MSGLMDKAKESLSGNKAAQGFADKQVNTRSYPSDGPSSFPSHTDNHIEVDNATDKAGLGDKYDKKISDGINKQTNDQIFNKK